MLVPLGYPAFCLFTELFAVEPVDRIIRHLQRKSTDTHAAARFPPLMSHLLYWTLHSHDNLQLHVCLPRAS